MDFFYFFSFYFFFFFCTNQKYLICALLKNTRECLFRIVLLSNVFPLAPLANDDIQCLDLLKSYGSLWDVNAMYYSVLLLNSISNKQERQCIPLVCYSVSSNLIHIFIYELLHWETTIDSYSEH